MTFLLIYLLGVIICYYFIHYLIFGLDNIIFDSYNMRIYMFLVYMFFPVVFMFLIFYSLYYIKERFGR